MKREKKKFKHFKLAERHELKEYLECEKFKKKNGTPNYSKIGKVMNKSRNTIRLEAKRLKEEYYDPKKANDDYKNKRKKSIKYTTIRKKVVNHIRKILSKRRYSPMLIIHEYEKNIMKSFHFHMWHFTNILNMEFLMKKIMKLRKNYHLKEKSLKQKRGKMIVGN